MGGFYKLSIFITRFASINILWFLFNLPMVYMLVISIDNPQSLQMGLISIAFLTPFIFFPATTAMYGVVRKWVLDEWDIPIWRSFLKYYKENYKRSLLGGIVFSLFWTGWILNYYMFFHQQSVFLIFLFIMITAFLFTWNSYFLSYTVHFEMKFINQFKGSFILTLSHPASIIAVSFVNGGLIYLSYNFAFIIPFFLGSLGVYVSFLQFYKAIQKTISFLEAKGDL